jgi:hypothetical protein
MDITELPEWLAAECKEDPTIKELVQMGIRNKCSVERVLDTVARFVMDREQLVMHQLWRYRKLYGKLPVEETATASQVDSKPVEKKERPRLITALSSRPKTIILP